jgi:hypothetical protein
MPMLTPNIIARESLLVLSNNMVASSLVYKGDTSNFTGAAVGDTITIRRPASFAVNEFASSISTQGVNEGSVPLVLEKHFDISVELTSKQTTLELNDFAEQVIRPAMTNMAEAIDSYIYSKYVEVFDIVGDGALNSVADLAGADRKLMEKKVPMSGRVGFLSPAAKAAFLSIDNLNRLDTRGAAGQAALTEASLGRVMAIDFYGAQGVARHVPGVPGGTPVAAAAAGATAVAVTAGGNAGTFKKGDIVSFAGVTQTFVVTADLTLNSSGAGTLNIAPALTATISAAAVTVTAAHDANLIGHPRGLSLASVPLELPMEAMGAATLAANGFNIRVVYDYDINSKKNVISFDCLVGAKVTDPRLLSRFNAG